MEKKMNKNLENKVLKVSQITDRLNTSKSMVMVDFKGITVEEITALRVKFREAGVDYVVLKNSLMKRALNNQGITELDELLVGPSAFAFGMKDEVAPAKIISEFIEQTKSDKMTIKAGIIEGKVVDTNAVIALSKLPPREVLIAKMMGSLNAPITNFVGVLSATLRSLVYAVDAIRKQKEGIE
ncbi:MAG TPA: 50S ribosomal protein L10 [Clostridia bacterium]|jgi:large subunit ribosomal protein L10|nr:50S ribosomal protein L10 [Clostridia bacterium]HQA98376.1 50S ribosomal protein L10 [Clostridia bacterium]HQO56526.1 50S ribosomal protein L10 [Clostridia bacterium]